MALLFHDSFDHYDWAIIGEKWTQTSGGSNDTSTITTVGARGTKGLRLSSTGAGTANSKRVHIVPYVAPGDARSIFGYRFRHPGAFTINAQSSNDANNVATNCLWQIRWGGVCQLWGRLNTAGGIDILNGAGTSLGTMAFALTQNAFQFLTFSVLLHGSAGTVDVYVDGTLRLALTAKNTQSAGVSTWNELILGHTSGWIAGTLATEWNIDDVYLADGTGSYWNSPKHGVYWDSIFVDANGTTRNWARSAGSDDYALVDEASANGDTDYLSTAGVGDIVTMGVPNSPTSTGIIEAVSVVAEVKKDSAGLVGHKGVVRMGGTNYFSTEKNIAAGYTIPLSIFERRPTDGAAWTPGDIDAAGFEIGIQKSA